MTSCLIKSLLDSLFFLYYKAQLSAIVNVPHHMFDIKQYCSGGSIQDLSDGQAQTQDSGANMTLDVTPKRSFSIMGGGGGVCGMLHLKILKLEMLRYSFSALLGVL